MTHQELCNRALRWLSGTWRCEPVFCGIASCSEIPDAIGWSSVWKHDGSTVIECKTSRSDFYADKKKRFMWQHKENGWRFPSKRMTAKSAEEGGYASIELPLMGNFRFYFSEPEVLTPELVEQHAPDHGLLYREGRRVRVIRQAPRREPDYAAEIRYLRFAIINAKNPHEPLSMPATRFEDIETSPNDGGMKLF